MDRNSLSADVAPSASASIAATQVVISHIRSFPPTPGSPEPLVQPILHPRFAISCTPPLLSKLGDIGKSDPSIRIQTHISENKEEVRRTKELFPWCPHYAGVYDWFKLLNDKTILAHAVHLEKEECELIKARRAGISHCPTSNFNLRSGIAPVGKYLDMGIKVGLGTDVSGGFNLSMLQAVRSASISSKIIAFQSPSPSPHGKFASKQLPISALLYLATLGGAEVCGLDQAVGSLVEGKSFDALIVSVRNDAGNPSLWGADFDIGDGRSEEDKLKVYLERFLFTGDDRNIRRVYVQGKLVGGTEFRTPHPTPY